MLAGMPPTLRIATLSRWDYVQADGKALNEKIYGKEMADKVDRYFQESTRSGAWPDYAATPWKMAIFAGSNTANWRSGGGRWRETVFEKLETIVTMAPGHGRDRHVLGLRPARSPTTTSARTSCSRPARPTCRCSTRPCRRSASPWTTGTP